MGYTWSSWLAALIEGVESLQENPGYGGDQGTLPGVPGLLETPSNWVSCCGAGTDCSLHLHLLVTSIRCPFVFAKERTLSLMSEMTQQIWTLTPSL